jgi:hypothetical protein
VHSASVPVKVAQRLAMPVDSNTIFFTDSFKQVTSKPDLVTSFFRTFREDLEFPLSCCNLSIDTFYIKASVKTSVKMLLNNFAAICVLSTY